MDFDLGPIVGARFNRSGDVKDGAVDKLPELDTFAIPEAHDEAFADQFGDLTVSPTGPTCRTTPAGCARCSIGCATC